MHIYCYEKFQRKCQRPFMYENLCIDAANLNASLKDMKYAYVQIPADNGKNRGLVEIVQKSA